MRIQKTVEPTLQPPVARAATDKPAAKATSFDADTFVRSGRNPDGDVGGNGDRCNELAAAHGPALLRDGKCRWQRGPIGVDQTAIVRILVIERVRHRAIDEGGHCWRNPKVVADQLAGPCAR
jgi:hypothetical protein